MPAFGRLPAACLLAFAAASGGARLVESRRSRPPKKDQVQEAQMQGHGAEIQELNQQAEIQVEGHGAQIQTQGHAAEIQELNHRAEIQRQATGRRSSIRATGRRSRLGATGRRSRSRTTGRRFGRRATMSRSRSRTSGRRPRSRATGAAIHMFVPANESSLPEILRGLVRNGLLPHRALVIAYRARMELMPADPDPKLLAGDAKAAAIQKFVGDPEGDGLCPICWESMRNLEGQDTLLATVCEHVYHEKCLKDWIGEGGDSCPMCKAELVEKHVCHGFCLHFRVHGGPLPEGGFGTGGGGLVS